MKIEVKNKKNYREILENCCFEHRREFTLKGASRLAGLKYFKPIQLKKFKKHF